MNDFAFYHFRKPANGRRVVRRGLLWVIAMLSATRSSILPTLPSAQEQGLSNFAADNWIAFFLPKHTPAEIVQRLHGAAIATMETPSVRQLLKDNGADVVSPERRSSEYLQKFVEAQVEKWCGLDQMMKGPSASSGRSKC